MVTNSLDELYVSGKLAPLVNRCMAKRRFKLTEEQWVGPLRSVATQAGTGATPFLLAGRLPKFLKTSEVFMTQEPWLYGRPSVLLSNLGHGLNFDPGTQWQGSHLHRRAGRR